jgi:RNase adaptor protein for sRNA GlmZ degradation
MPGPTLHLFSFGYKFDGPPRDESGHGGGFVFDCRALPNPFWDLALRPFAGTDPAVVSFFESQPEVAEFLAHARQLVLYTARTYARLERHRLMVAFGCTGGRHRSVYLADRLTGDLMREGFPVVLIHRDVERGSGGEPSQPAARP